jgi:hypothetical protein
MRSATLLIALGLTVPAMAQDVKFPAKLEKLSAKAEESVDVTLEGPMLKLTAQFLSSNDPDQAKVKKILAGLENITVKSYQFADENGYDPADLQTVRDQLKMPLWSRLLGVKSKGGQNADIYLKVTPDGMIGGVVIISEEPRQFTLVSISGKLDLTQLADLGGRYHIPAFDLDVLNHGRGGK